MRSREGGEATGMDCTYWEQTRTVEEETGQAAVQPSATMTAVRTRPGSESDGFSLADADTGEGQCVRMYVSSTYTGGDEDEHDWRGC